MSTESFAGVEPEEFDSHAGPGCDQGFLRIELRHLRYFVGLAEELHFGRAAARMFISQPGLSQAIARLEQALDVKLFTRTHRNVELTGAGLELLHRARRLLAAHADDMERVRSVGRGEVGSVRLGIALLAEPLLTTALKAFEQEHEGIVLDRYLTISERLLDQLQEGRMQAAVIHQLPRLFTAEGVEWEPLRRGPMAVVASSDSELAQRQRVTLSELSGETFLINPRSLAPGAFEGLKLMCRQYGGFDAKVVESTAMSTLVLDADWSQIETGEAIVVMAEAAARSARLANVTVVPVEPPPEYVIALALCRGEQSRPVQQLLDHLRTHRDQHAWIVDTSAGSAPTPISARATRQAPRRLVGEDQITQPSFVSL